MSANKLYSRTAKDSWTSVPHKSSKTITPQTQPRTQYRTSPQPSVGMILYCQSGPELLYGLVKRKYGYGIIRALTVNFSDNTCFTEICNVERKALLYVCSMQEHWEHIYAKLWIDSMWNKDTTSRNYRECMEKFINNRHIIQQHIKETKSIFPNGIWGFPKGKPEFNESDIDCALREVKEETMVEKVNIQTVPVQKEIYKDWHYAYFVASVDSESACNRQIDNPEISAVAWCTYDQAIKLFPKDAVDKKKILKNIKQIVERIP
jgi:ADP-ribose pyrophosphatase YjhB (NUDIX family)